jgi:cell wall-associated NlpC family hydrolase
MLTTIRWTVLLLLTGLLFNLSGCSGKKTVTYIPKERHKPNLQQLRQQAQQLRQQQSAKRAEALKNYFTDWMGTRYALGGLSRKGVDCSGFTLLTYQELFGRKLPRTVKEQVQEGTAVKKEFLQPGDLVFFKIGVFQKHVGIYLEDDRFIHASRSSGVMISRLDDTYWKKRYWQAKRMQSTGFQEEDYFLSEDLQGSL